MTTLTTTQLTKYNNVPTTPVDAPLGDLLAELLASQGGSATGVTALTYAATVDLDFDQTDWLTLELAGDVTFTSSNRTGGKLITLRVEADADRSLSYPVTWRFFGPKPTFLAAGQFALLHVYCFGTASTDIFVVAEVRGGLQIGGTPTQNIQFADLGSPYMQITVGANLTFTGSGMSAGLGRSIQLIGSGGPWTLTFPAGWKFLGSAAPTDIADGATGVLSLTAFGSNESDVVAAYAVTP